MLSCIGMLYPFSITGTLRGLFPDDLMFFFKNKSLKSLLMYMHV